MSRFLTGLTAAMLLLGAAAPLQAQREPPVLRPGQEVAATLSAQDPVLSGNGHFRAYRLPVRLGHVYRITMRSSEFDAYLRLGRTVGGVTDFFRDDDDSGGGTDAQLTFRPAEAGTYYVAATSFGGHADGAATGAFTLLVEEWEDRPAEIRPIAVGASVTGELDVFSSELDDGRHYDAYRLQLAQGQHVRIDLESDDFDAFLSFGRIEQGEYVETHRDDDGGVGTDSRLRFTAPESGEYALRVMPFSRGSGSYTLRVEAAEPPRAEPKTRALQAGRAADILGDDDALLEDGRSFQHWTFSGRAGERVVIDLMSDEFDAYLVFGRMVSGEFVEIDRDDDGGDGTDSRLELTLDEDGEYVVRVTSYGAGMGGNYTLRVTPAEGRAAGMPL